MTAPADLSARQALINEIAEHSRNVDDTHQGFAEWVVEHMECEGYVRLAEDQLVCKRELIDAAAEWVSFGLNNSSASSLARDRSRMLFDQLRAKAGEAV